MEDVPNPENIKINAVTKVPTILGAIILSHLFIQIQPANGISPLTTYMFYHRGLAVFVFEIYA
jgi:hypothetical protein